MFVNVCVYMYVFIHMYILICICICTVRCFSLTLSADVVDAYVGSPHAEGANAGHFAR